MNPEARKISQELDQEFSDFQNSVMGWDVYDREAYAYLTRRATELASIDAAASSTLLAKLASVVGDFEQFERWVKNLRNLRQEDVALQMQFMHFVNHGYSSRGQEILPDVFSRRAGSNFSNIAVGAMAVGAFRATFEAISDSSLRSEVLAMTDVIDKLKTSYSTIVELGISDAEVGRMFDEAGNIIRDNRLTWSSNSMAVISIPEQSGGPAMSVEWHIGVSPSRAAELTWELTDRLVSKDLDRPRFSIGFLGIDIA